MKKKLFSQESHYIILAFVIALILLVFTEMASANWAVEEYHDSTAGSTTYNAGLDRLCIRKFNDNMASISFCPVIAVGGDVQRDSWEIAFADQWNRWEGQIALNRTDGNMDGAFTVRRMVGDGPFQMSIGVTRWLVESPGSNSNLTFNLGLRYTWK